VKKLALQFAGFAVAFAIVGSILAVSQYGSGWSDIGKALLTFAVTLGVGGAAAVWVKSVEQIREDRAAWRDLLRDVVEVDQTVAVARQLIAAHKTAKTYSEQYANILAARLTLRRVWLDPLVANDKIREGEDKPIRDHLDRMKEYVDKLGEEYEKFYLPVARQQRIDEEYLKHRTGELASHRRAPPTPTDQVNGPAADRQRPLGLDDPYYLPTRAWTMLRDPQRFKLLTEFLDAFERSHFVGGFTDVKPMLERRAGIKEREYGFEPAVLPTPANTFDQQRRGPASSST
jgi:hypothetical protein